MTHSATLPFSLRRGADAYSGATVTTTRETVHGLLVLRGGQLTIQWRLARKTEEVGWRLRSGHEIEPVRQTSVPVSRVAGATVRSGRWNWLGKPHLVLTASDLTALQALAGSEGLGLDHPAELVADIRREDRLAAEEFCAELALAIAAHEQGGDTMVPRAPAVGPRTPAVAHRRRYAPPTARLSCSLCFR